MNEYSLLYLIFILLLNNIHELNAILNGNASPKSILTNGENFINNIETNNFNKKLFNNHNSYIDNDQLLLKNVVDNLRRVVRTAYRNYHIATMWKRKRSSKNGLNVRRNNRYHHYSPGIKSSLDIPKSKKILVKRSADLNETFIDYVIQNKTFDTSSNISSIIENTSYPTNLEDVLNNGRNITNIQLSIGRDENKTDDLLLNNTNSMKNDTNHKNVTMNNISTGLSQNGTTDHLVTNSSYVTASRFTTTDSVSKRRPTMRKGGKKRARDEILEYENKYLDGFSVISLPMRRCPHGKRLHRGKCLDVY